MADSRQMPNFLEQTRPAHLRGAEAPWQTGAGPLQNVLPLSIGEEPPRQSLCQGYSYPASALCLLVFAVVTTIALIRVTQWAAMTAYPDDDLLAPITKRRFETPRPAAPWKRILRAYRDGPSCYQPGPARDHPVSPTASQSENCLYVNVWIPLCADSLSNCSRRTIVVYFHGGNLRRGSNSMPVYDGAVLSALGQVIVAVPNYRLGVFGFLSRKVNGTRENLGLLDQVLAVEWVANNSEVLGGHRDDVVVFGHDWGAYTASLFLVSPALRQRFRITKAILGSGSLFLPSRFAHNDSHWRGFLKKLGCGEHFFENTLSCLRKAHPKRLLAAQSWYPGSVGVVHPHAMLPRQPGQFLRLAHNFSSVQLLLTSTSLEGLGVLDKVTAGISGTAAAGTLSPENLLARTGLHVAGDEPRGLLELWRDRIGECYELPRGSAEYGSAFAVSFLGDALFNCPSLLFARRMCQTGRAGLPRHRRPKAALLEPNVQLPNEGLPHGRPVLRFWSARLTAAQLRQSNERLRGRHLSAGGRVFRRVIRLVTDFAKNGAGARL
ncbi:hypothetical protein HPB49_016165 [Dermacentor silvarum]|uniref:Uncharacterized protein n=1 Tax=Dermacentor silvarum TaxID=543639 RepID=A0ACB8DEH0_DERSI|nr:hypothetical protein HPB49_016165 [Dermacentor silvarum]